jgi:hypothetical protein
VITELGTVLVLTAALAADSIRSSAGR